jgi:hypothetical protein
MSTVVKANKVSVTAFPGTSTISPRLEETGHLSEALAAEDVAEAAAVHKNAFFAEKDGGGNRIDYVEAVHRGLTLLPTGTGYDALRHDYQRMIEDGLLVGDAETFEVLMTRCAGIQAQLKRRPQKVS